MQAVRATLGLCAGTGNAMTQASLGVDNRGSTRATARERCCTGRMIARARNALCAPWKCKRRPKPAFGKKCGECSAHAWLDDGDRRIYIQALHPAFDAIGVGDTRELAPRIEQNDDHRLRGDGRLHDQTAARLIDVAGLGKTDLPVMAAHQTVRVAEGDCPFAAIRERNAMRLAGG